MNDSAFNLRRLELERLIAVFSDSEKERIHRAFEIAEFTHAEQKRPDGEAYINHPLRVALTVLRDFRVVDADIVCAALLHDVVEDQSERLVATYGEEDDEHKALYVIERMFGHRVARTVKGLSNPEVVGSPEAKNIFYKEHVREAIQDEAVAVVELADFYDNAFRLDRVPAEKRPSFIAKYGPVIRDVWMPAIQSIKEGHPLFLAQEHISMQVKKVYTQLYE
ncbi:MAG: HD domain-containing protein [Candidatus Kerfeldbacteria bacterium]|nr:HD domain-containing protein [Candidatus Kerfeldbacteria bacterium]